VSSVLVWILYDIVEDKPRNKVAKECKKYDLVQVPKSVFLGKLKPNRFDELGKKCLSLIDEDTDSVYLFPICQEDFRRVKVLGQGFDRKLVNTDERFQIIFETLDQLLTMDSKEKKKIGFMVKEKGDIRN
jgi:CRISPR-associated protein Cas2